MASLTNILQLTKNVRNYCKVPKAWPRHMIEEHVSNCRFESPAQVQHWSKTELAKIPPASRSETLQQVCNNVATALSLAFSKLHAISNPEGRPSTVTWIDSGMILGILDDVIAAFGCFEVLSNHPILADWRQRDLLDTYRYEVTIVTQFLFKILGYPGWLEYVDDFEFDKEEDYETPFGRENIETHPTLLHAILQPYEMTGCHLPFHPALYGPMITIEKYNAEGRYSPRVRKNRISPTEMC